MKKIGFIGAGNMAAAIIEGLQKSGADFPVFGYDKDLSRVRALSSKGLKACASAQELVECSDIVVLAVKPQNVSEVLLEIKSAFNQDKLLVSIAAGIGEPQIKKHLGTSCRVVLVMPNTPILLLQGATAISAGDGVKNEELDFVRDVFARSGVVEIISSEKMKEIIAVNGSSPAFVYLFAKTVADWAEKQGISRAAAFRLICATFKGSASMLEQHDHGAEELIAAVTSPGGTTEAALKVLEDRGFGETLKKAMDACTARAYELSSN